MNNNLLWDLKLERVYFIYLFFSRKIVEICYEKGQKFDLFKGENGGQMINQCDKMNVQGFCHD